MALCEHGYSDNYTEEELGDVLEEMGKTIDPAYIPRLKSEIDRVVAEIDKENDDCYEADMLPLFSSLRLDDSIQENRLGTRNMQNILFSDSPIRSTRHNAVTNAQVVRNQYLKNINSNIIPLALQTNAEDDEMTECIQDPLKIKSFLDISNTNINTRKDVLSDEKQRLEGKDRMGTIPRITPTDIFQPEYQKADYIENKPDPSIRPVLYPAPGQLAYRHDPVKKFELYREEWARRPAPGDEKRLALRWKVREYMLRLDLPKYDPSKGYLGPVNHPKDWSPRAYLD